MPEQQKTKSWQEALQKIEQAKRSGSNELNLAQLDLVSIPDSLRQLNNLQTLYLTNNLLTTVPNFLIHLTKLRNLYLYGNQLTVVPECLTQLANLHALGLSHNQLSTIPDSIAKLTNLQMLDLNGNQLSAIPDSIAQLSNLQTLDLRNNALTTIPESLAQLVNLKTLDLRNNNLVTIPNSLRQLQNLTELFLHENPDLGVPDEILGPKPGDVTATWRPKPPWEILDYMSRLADSRSLNEAKLIMVGQGGVGKTSLVKKLTTGKFNRGEESTLGIKISDWICSVTSNDRVTVHIWDFGGQEMLHATHQFFLTQRSLYLLVLNRRQGGPDREADYWFRLIRAFGGKDAPVIVVLNKQKSEPFDVNRGGWLEKYAGNIKGFVETDCMDGKSIKVLEQKIREELKGLSSIKASFPRRWFAIKNELSHMASQFITFEDYRAICRKHREDDPESQTSLAGFLHDLGIALNYKDDPRLRFAYVLKPEWITEGIYALLNAFVATKGLFAHAEAERVLKPKGYSPEAAEFILGLMEQFELSFPLGDAQRRVLIPQLLDDQQSAEALTFKATDCLNFGYQYSIVPEGLLPRFIVRTQHLSQPATRWKSGVILHDLSTRCRALVRADMTEAQVRIHIDGPQPSRRELLGIIRYNFDVIHSDYESKPRALVYPPGIPEKPLQLDDLEALSSSGATATAVVLPDRRVITSYIADLTEPTKAAHLPLKLFLCYAHKDERYVNELRKDLKLMERNGLIRPWYDRPLAPAEKWEPRILQELGEADVVVCQLTQDFLVLDFLALAEFDRLAKRKIEGKAALFAYVLKRCAWTEVGRLANFQILPLDAHPLDSWQDKDRYWRAIAEGIQEALKALRTVHPDRGNNIAKNRSGDAQRAQR